MVWNATYFHIGAVVIGALYARAFKKGYPKVTATGQGFILESRRFSKSHVRWHDVKFVQNSYDSLFLNIYGTPVTLPKKAVNHNDLLLAAKEMHVLVLFENLLTPNDKSQFLALLVAGRKKQAGEWLMRELNVTQKIARAVVAFNAREAKALHGP